MPPEAIPVKYTVNGTSPDVGDAMHEATSGGGGGAVTDMVKESESWLLLLSVTVRIAV